MSQEGDRIPVSMIKPHPLNPRQDFSMAREIAESIRENGGHPWHPILVAPWGDGYQIVWGHTRFIAMKEYLGYTELEVGSDRDIVVKEMDDAAAVRMMVDDNLRRSDYNPAERADALKLLMDTLGIGIREVARRYGTTASWIEDHLNLNRLPDRVKKRVRDGKRAKGRNLGSPCVRAPEHGDSQTVGKGEGVVTVSHARQLVRLDNHGQEMAAALAVEKHNLTSKETRNLVNYLRKNPWTPLEDAVNVVQTSSNALNPFVVELKDARVAHALSRAAEASEKTPEQYAAEKMVEGLVNDGFLNAKFLECEEYRQWYERETLATEDPSQN